MAILATADGDLRAAMGWLILALVIDGVDGTLARRARVKEVLPHVSGRDIDYVIDFAGYAIVPTYMLYTAHLCGDWDLPIAFAVLLTSAIYYGKGGMVSEDQYFVGFPVMWNLVAFYLIFVAHLTAAWNIGIILALCLLHFIPIKFAYPSRTRKWRWGSISVTLVGVTAGLVLLYCYPREYWALRAIVLGALFYFAVFAVLATYVFAGRAT